MELCSASAARTKTPAATGRQRYNDEVMSRKMATEMTRPGGMLFGRRTWQAVITAWDARPSWGRSRYTCWSICRLLGPSAVSRAICSSCAAGRSSACVERLAAALGGARKAAAI
jgi:hypothetical protein